MSSVNKAIIVGNVGKDPEIRFTQAGKKIANFTVATSERWKDRQTGEQREQTEWHRIVVFNEGRAGVVEKYVRKGSKVYVEGALKTRKWQDKNGRDNYTTEVVLNGFGATLVLLDGKQGDGARPQNDPGTHSQGGQAADDMNLSDEIPF